ncbi:hypothetical protein Pmani_009271 [Petrolisthes manimaculis]|uniref:FYVE-type domain-containing protein n=1 Tax=Petrolisthes manimaculis TaxID=1843537 RepID=A0AAE1Q3U0_9EUCA|nr:hypothetical protein Pmani_009271 [Petrolisthes manimaculis]
MPVREVVLLSLSSCPPCHPPALCNNQLLRRGGHESNMENFAVDLDKLLDDFELDEDESEAVSGYDKVQLEFCSAPAPVPPSRHGSGLGAFGGWSEPLQPQPAAGWGRLESQPPGDRSPPDGQNDDSQTSVNCSHLPLSTTRQQQQQVPQLPLPTSRNPPLLPTVSDTQPSHLTSSHPHPPLPDSTLSQQPPSSSSPSVYPQPQPPVSYPQSFMSTGYSQPTNTSSQPPPANSQSSLDTLSQLQPQSVALGTSQPSSATLSQLQSPSVSLTQSQSPSVPLSQSQPPSVPVSQSQPPSVPLNQSQPPTVPVVSGEECNDQVDGTVRGAQLLWPSMVVSEAGVCPSVPPQGPSIEAEAELSEARMGEGRVCEGLDVIASRPLDVIPASVPPDRGLANGHEARHPDIIDVWQSGGEGGSSPELGEIVDQGSPRNVSVEQPAPPEHRLLPDLMANNSMEGAEGTEYPEPAIVMENALSRLQLDEPAIVQESQSMGRLPEVANVHQTTEHQHPPEESQDPIGAEADRTPGLLEDHMATVSSENQDKPDEHSDTPEHLESGGSEGCENRNEGVPGLPDVSVVVPLAFSKGADLADADLDAELAELEEEQSRLQGAYGGPLPPPHPGPDLIGGTGPQQSQEGCGPPSVALVEEVACHTHHNPPDNNSSSAGGDGSGTGTGTGTSTSTGTGSSSSDREREEGDGPCDASTGDGNSSGTDTASSTSTLTDGDLSPVHVATTEDRGQDGSDVPQSPTRITPGTLVTAVYDDDSGSGREDEGGIRGLGRDSHPSQGGSVPVAVGLVAPFWVPDEDAPGCQECQQKFTVLRRRHHCRACGRVLCAACCHDRAPLPYMDNKEARVCASCLALIHAPDHEGHGSDSGGARGGGAATGAGGRECGDAPGRPPDPNNPMEYCSRVPPPQQVAASPAPPPPTVMVPVGVLKREGSSSSSRSKQVMFSDGIRPGGDLTEGEVGGGPGGGGDPPPPYGRRPGRVTRRVDRPLAEYVLSDGAGSSGGSGSSGSSSSSGGNASGNTSVTDNSTDLTQQLRGDGPPVAFALHKNLTVLVKLVKLECCVGVEVWNMATRGLCTVGQEEVVVLLEVAGEGETQPPRDIFPFFTTLYNQANQGQLVTALGHTIFSEAGGGGLLGSRDHGGFLYVRPTFQCLRSLLLPPPPYIFAILIQKWETPWAKVFPLRLMLRMGAEFRYYPCPLVSTRNRKPVFCEIGHTIMNLLVDFRNYSYTVPSIEGFVIHMEDKRTSLLFPRNRYDQVTKALSNSNDHVLALGANFSPLADSHLVTIENEDGHYSTQAINIHNRPRKVTGASFIVFNGALKTTSGLSAKSSIVEDGLMVQIPGDMMTKLRDALQNMRDFDIPCGPLSAPQPDEVVSIRWTSDDKNFNVGIKSPVDEREMDGVPSVKIHSGTDYVSNSHLIRWTEVFIIQGDTNNSGDVNLSRLWEVLARSFCLALTPHLAELASGSHTRLALRTTVHQDSVGYEAGSGGRRLPDPCMRDLDAELIPVIHRAASNITQEPIILELLFHILEQ